MSEAASGAAGMPGVAADTPGAAAGMPGGAAGGGETAAELARTIEARLLDDDDLAQTLVRFPRETIEPHRRASTGGVGAVDELRRVGGSLGDKLRLVSTLGEGGMGVVHLATQATVGRHVAVKTLKAGRGGVDATLRLLREAWVTGALEHPNVVPIYDVGVDGQGAPVIVMKRVEGRAWSDLLSAPDELCALVGQADPLEANLRILIAVCNAVHFAHSKGILHRDIKPENVMIGAFGEVYVLDWGIAVSLRDDPSGRLPLASQATEVAGTPSYMAPEMLLGDPAVLSPRTDVYLLGATLYEIFAGRPPHTGANLQAMIASILLSEPPFSAPFPQEARRICERAMARDPASRFESAEALRAAVEEYARHRGSRKLAREARKSLEALTRALEDEPSEERTLAIFNLLGECRFGYRAALSAWPGNEAARRGLDRALVGVVEHELGEGDPQAAALLLREVTQPPPGLAARVEAALRARADEEERLRKLGQDHDPTVGTRTRTAIGAFFGVLWTATPLVGWCATLRGVEPSHALTVGPSFAFLIVGALLHYWARDSLGKTLLNRRLALTVGLHLVLQIVLGTGAFLAGLSPWQSQVMHVFSWSLTQGLLAVWLEPWLGACAAACALSFLIACARPSWLYPLMAADNVIVTAVLVRVWLPKQDIALVMQRRRELRSRARKVFLDLARRPAGDDEA